MAIYRTIQMSFWTDSDVVDEYTPEDKLFYLYLLTNPHTNLCGCYEVSVAQLSTEVGYSRKKIKDLIERAEMVHKTIVYDQKTKELLVINWHKYNWTTSEKFRKPLLREIDTVKCADFKAYLMDLYNGADTVSIPYPYRTDTTVTDIDNNKAKNKVNFTTKKVNNKQSKKVKDIYYPNDEILDDAFRDFVAMRKSIKSPMTDRAIKIAMNKLEDLSKGDNDLAVRLVEEAIEHNWKSFYPLKDKRSKDTSWEDA